MGGPHNGRFDFLGFEFYWEADRQGKPRVKRRTATKKWLAGMQRMREWIKTHRHQKLRRTMNTLKAKLRGTWNYYGLIGNFRRSEALLRSDLSDATQVAQPAESAPEYDLASLQSDAGAFPSAATAHGGEERTENALPAGVESLPTVAEIPATGLLTYARANDLEEPGALCGQLGYVVLRFDNSVLHWSF